MLLKRTLSLAFSCENIYVNQYLFCFRKDQYLFNSQSSFTLQNKAFEQQCKSEEKQYVRKFDARSHVTQEL